MICESLVSKTFRMFWIYTFQWALSATRRDGYGALLNIVFHFQHCYVLSTCRSSPATVTTMSTRRTYLSHPSMPDSSASCHGRGMSASRCEWNCWAATSSTSPPSLPPSLPFLSSHLLLCLAPSLPPEPCLHCLAPSTRGQRCHTTLHSWGGL